MMFEEGLELAPLEFPVTTSAIVAGAMATNDFEPVHHDKSAAQATGVPDIFMNILTTNGIVQRFVTQRLGKKVCIRSVKLRLGAPNFAGDVLVLSGRITNANEIGATVEVEGRNAIGQHVTAAIKVELAENTR